ncbi:MAG TPA: tetratricopeptide repeat protein [Thermoanaerobaculia bacterium]|nr:tetratricopeptide repeat protein [Thermoanaerobaculia bacterium]
MKRAFLASSSLLLVAVLTTGCSSGRGKDAAGTQEQFGVRMAKMNLWREALFRFQRVVEIAPDDAMAHNNLAVAYEANGDFENALKEYREAIRLDRSNPYIQKNYSRFVEFTSRNRKRQQQNAAARTAAAASDASDRAAEAAADPAEPATGPPVEPPMATPATASGPPVTDPPGSDTSPSPAGAAPVSIPSPSPQPEQTPPPAVNPPKPDGVLS